ncbi:MAG: hypothetical protein JSV00_00120, partial [bacterium]
ALAVLKNIPLWLALAVISRDVILALGSLTVYLMQGHLTVRPRPVGKVTTFFQFSCILVFLLASMGTNVAGAFLRITGPLSLITAMLTVVSGAVYILDGFRALEE